MKNIFLLAALFCAELGFCQSANPFETVEKIEADGITFEVRQTKYTFMVSNADNSYVYRANWCYKDGRELETEEEYASVNAVDNMWAQNRAFREAFGDEVIESLRVYRSSPMTVFYAIGPEGNTLEVAFIMVAKPELLALPLSVFASLERKLKEYVTWRPNDFAKQLEFFHGFNSVFFNDLPLSSEISQKPPKAGFELIKPNPGEPVVWP
ncbi:MAG: DUF5043 domain-containing protein [Alistipes sp.]|nr:DUF5043 domain-containing protein [Alistipes senegalensis]MCM1250850.1 DUF5043 domain-containing protein [Alistipes sp.]